MYQHHRLWAPILYRWCRKYTTEFKIAAPTRSVRERITTTLFCIAIAEQLVILVISTVFVVRIFFKLEVDFIKIRVKVSYIYITLKDHYFTKIYFYFDNLPFGLYSCNFLLSLWDLVVILLHFLNLFYMVPIFLCSWSTILFIFTSVAVAQYFCTLLFPDLLMSQFLWMFPFFSSRALTNI